MAFPVPDHLPKRAIPVDVSSKILYKVDAATKDTLSSSLAASWIRELDESIQATKVRLTGPWLSWPTNIGLIPPRLMI